MKKTVFVCMLCLLLVFPPVAGADAARPVLVTAYRQAGWGDSVQIGYVDEAGGLWFLQGNDGELKWPYAAAEQLAWLQTSKGFASLGTLPSDDLFALNSLVQCVELQDGKATPAANDAGTEASYAVRYQENEAEIIPLGMSGDDLFENTDASAQALYLFLRQCFPGVTSYFGHSHMGPAGFRPVSLQAFCGYDGAMLSGAKAMKTDIDCEEAREPVALSKQEADGLVAKILSARVVGKHSCIVTTGGSTVYSFEDENGAQLAIFEFYHGLLVRPDGMYLLSE